MLETLEKYHKDGLLHKQVHPTLPLTIWNYSPKVQYEKLWDNVTINCRGLVTDDLGNIVALPFQKFFNYEEYSENQIPKTTFEVYEKMDGSLGILFNYNGEWIIATRGSFISEQAIKAKELLDKYNINWFFTDCTYLVEIIYPKNRIVVDYKGEEKLVLLSIIQTSTGIESEYENMLVHAKSSGIPVVKRYDGLKDHSSLKKLISDDNEGFVLRFRGGFRVKIKGDEYVRLHRILTNISNRDIWEYLKDGKSLDDILEKVPDEFYNWVKDTKNTLLDNFSKIEKEYLNIFDSIKNVEDRKSFASKATEYPLSSILFSMYDNRDYKQIIWKNLYPDYSKPFKNEYE
jgi:RNA ligase